MESPYRAVIESPIPHVPRLGLRYDGDGLSAIEFLPQARACFNETIALSAVEALRHYLSARPEPLQLPLRPRGTAFQHRVWLALRAIPFGEVRRYGELAEELGSSARAVAGACRANPLPVVVPCHRVLAANGPGGYMGQTAGEALAIKVWLLQHEGYV